MQIPYETSARPDTGLYNAKLGIWLFLASEVMLFGGLFSGYLFLRLGAEDGYWPQGLLNVPVGTFNTAVLIASSVTIVLTWANLKMRKWAAAQRYLLTTILCGVVFLVVKLAYEYPQKFQHFGAYIKKDAAAQYEQYLGNKGLKERGKPPRYEITGHLHGLIVETEGADKSKLDALLAANHLKLEADHHDPKHQIVQHASDPKKGVSPAVAEKIARVPGLKLIAFEVGMDEVNADAEDPVKSRTHDHAHFWHKPPTDKIAIIQAKDVNAGGWSSFAPKHNSYFAVYFTITGLHGLHVLAGVLVMAYFFFFGERIYRKNPEHQANRIEVVGLFWHFVDLVWIFVFPIFYLL
jgi:cytochrome c oxidase subunit III